MASSTRKHVKDVRTRLVINERNEVIYVDEVQVVDLPPSGPAYKRAIAAALRAQRSE